MIENQTLHIKGEKRQEKSGEGENTYWKERNFGVFNRVIALPNDVLSDKVQAAFKAGVLEIRLPKSEQARVKRIPVKGE